jgi:hypothetical protein
MLPQRVPCFGTEKFELVSRGKQNAPTLSLCLIARPLADRERTVSRINLLNSIYIKVKYQRSKAFLVTGCGGL